MYLSFHTPIFPLGIIDDGLSNDKKLIGSGQRTPLVFSNLCYKKNSIERIPRLIINENLLLCLKLKHFMNEMYSVSFQRCFCGIFFSFRK